MPTSVTPHPGKAVGKDAASRNLRRAWRTQGLGVVVALAVEFDATGQLKPGLEVFGFGLVEQSPLGVAQVVELGLCTRLPARV